MGISLSSHYVPEPVDPTDMKIASIAWGFTLGFGFLTGWKALRQTIAIWHRAHRITVSYVWMIWGELIVSFAFSIFCWLYLNGQLHPSFGYYFLMVTLWALQVQLLLQIIINRISLLMIDQRKAVWIKWGTAALITIINITVYCIWIPARLQISETYIHINDIWDRIEKTIYLVVDGCLNAYFIYLVKSKLISAGLQKYTPLFRFNIGIVFLSLSMDVMIISTMSLNNTFVYMQFHPVAYIVKLNIEMTMAQLISKVVRRVDRVDPSNSNSGAMTGGGTEMHSSMHASRLGDGNDNQSRSRSNRHPRRGSMPHVSFAETRFHNSVHGNVSMVNAAYDSDGKDLESCPEDGIVKTVSTMISSKSMESEGDILGSEASSTRDLTP